MIYFPQEVLNILTQPGLLMEWDPLVKDVSKVTVATTQDVVSISFNCTSIIAKTVCYLRECVGGEINAVYARQVHKLLFDSFVGVDERHLSSGTEEGLLILIKWSLYCKVSILLIVVYKCGPVFHAGRNLNCVEI